MSNEMETTNINNPLLKAKSIKILLSKDEVNSSTDRKIFVKFPHPAHKVLVPFCINVDLKKMYEIQVVKETYRSFLIDGVFSPDGAIYVSTPFDPTFLILPILKEKCSDKALPLEHIISALESENNESLKDIIVDLNDVADLKGPKDLCAYKYNEDKAITWLENKVKLVSATLKNTNINVTTSASSATYVQSEKIKTEAENDGAYLKYAFGIVSEYLTDELSNKLFNKFGFPADEIPTLSNKRKTLSEILASAVPEPDTKKPKLKKSDISPAKTINENEAPTKKPTAKKAEPSNKEKERLRAAVGSKSISSFFTKK